MLSILSTLATLIVAALAAVIPSTTPEPPAARPAPLVVSEIGGTPVPFGLDCEEDEAIYFTGPDTLDCVHVDSLTGG